MASTTSASAYPPCPPTRRRPVLPSSTPMGKPLGRSTCEASATGPGLGRYQFGKDQAVHVTLPRGGAGGRVVIEAIGFLRIGN